MVSLAVTPVRHAQHDLPSPTSEVVMPSARLVAHYMLAIGGEDDLISNGKLQKLLYYAQGCHLALYGEPLFPEEIHAGAMGPVVRDVWQLYAVHEARAIPVPRGLDFKAFTKRQADVIKEVYSDYGCYALWVLHDMTRQESPVCRTQIGEVITHKKLARYFSDHIDGMTHHDAASK